MIFRSLFALATIVLTTSHILITQGYTPRSLAIGLGAALITLLLMNLFEIFVKGAALRSFAFGGVGLALSSLLGQLLIASLSPILEPFPHKALIELGLFLSLSYLGISTALKIDEEFSIALSITRKAPIVSKPPLPAGEKIKIKIQRYGKEPLQGVGYLDDGTMVVVNGGGKAIGETIDATVLSVKQTTAGRIIFCNAQEEEEYAYING
jgi:uncharacterized protein YacL